MVTAIYISACALILLVLATNIVRLRRKHRVSLGDGGVKELQKAIGAQENATEYMPLALLLLLALEWNQSPLWIVHFFGVSFVVSRLMHAYGIMNKFKFRVYGMYLTGISLLGLVITNIFYLPFNNFL